MKTKNPKCKICRSPFVKLSMTHKCCGAECAIEWAKKEREGKNKKELIEYREKSKTRHDHLKDAQAAFNKWVRERDAKLPCISCGAANRTYYDAGHYRSVGAAPELRFHEDNCWKQCVPCNQHKGGNAVDYRIGLIGRIGIERVESLEKSRSPAKFTIEDAKRIKLMYKEKLKVLKAL